MGPAATVAAGSGAGSAGAARAVGAVRAASGGAYASARAAAARNATASRSHGLGDVAGREIAAVKVLSDAATALGLRAEHAAVGFGSARFKRGVRA